MSKSCIDKACAVVPEFENRISRFDKKMRIEQYAENRIYDYKLKVAQAVLYLQKLPDNFRQDDIEGYLSSLLDQKRYGISFFKHTVFGLQNYYRLMELIPARFVRIRHYGFLSPCNRETLRNIQRQLSVMPVPMP